MQLQCNNVKEIGEKAHRLANFELLRILAMLGVLLSHVFNYGLHIYPADAPDFTVDTSTFWGLVLWTLLQLIKLVSLVSVNCYVLITGYFMASRVEWRWKGIWRVWSTTWFYGMVCKNAQNCNACNQSPCGLFKDIGSLANTHNLV